MKKRFYQCLDCGFITDDKTNGCLACMSWELKYIGQFANIDDAMFAIWQKNIKSNIKHQND